MLAPRFPNPPTRGDQRRVFHLVEHLARVADVRVIAFGEGPALPFENVSARSVTRSPAGVARENLRMSQARLPLQVRLYLDSGMRRAVRGELERWRPHVVHATLARMASYLPPSGAAHRHLDLVDALSLNMAGRAKASWPGLSAVLAAEARLLESFEARAVAAADSSSLVSANDRRRAPGLGRSAVVPNGVDCERFPYREPSGRPRALIFFGNLGYFPNVEAARLVAREVLPRVRGEVPGARLRIVGARPAAAVRRLGRLDGVEIVGRVPDMARELHAAAVAILPMLSGTGMKNKVLEAFCAGTPVVSNRLGMEGIEGATAGRDHLGAEGADDLAAACAGLLRDQEARVALAGAAAALAREGFSWQRSADALLDLYGLGRAAP